MLPSNQDAFRRVIFGGSSRKLGGGREMVDIWGMIDVTQILVGNWYSHNDQWNEAGHNGPFQWQQRDWMLLDECLLFLENIEPLPLTTDWLERAGYRDIGMDVWSNNSDYNVDFNSKFESQLRLKTSDNYDYFGPIFNHVHELQLLMAGLGRPLTFTDKTS